MKAPTGEQCSALTSPQVEALELLQSISPTPHFVPSVQTAAALLNRGWISFAVPRSGVTAKTLYHITPAGRTALRIGARSPRKNGAA
jgi:hypothetical protein